MPDDATSTAETTDTTTDTAGEAAKTFTQEQVNTFLAEQKRKIGDVSKFKADSAELAAIKEAQKSTDEKAADQLAAAKRDVADARNESLRYRIAAEFKLSEKQAASLAHITSEDGMRDVAEQLAASDVDRKKQGNFVPREGSTTHSADSAELETTRALFGSN